MPYLSNDELKKIGFKKLGKNVKISDKAAIYNPEQIEIDDHSRIDDFCVISGLISIGKYCHITPQCLLAGGSPGLWIDDFCTFAYGTKIFSQSDDYSGQSMTNSLIPRKYKKEIFAATHVKRQVIIGAGSIIFPGVTIDEGCAIGAMTLVTESTRPWGIYIGSPARRLKERSKNLIDFEKEFLRDNNDSL